MSRLFRAPFRKFKISKVVINSEPFTIIILLGYFRSEQIYIKHIKTKHILVKPNLIYIKCYILPNVCEYMMNTFSETLNPFSVKSINLQFIKSS